MARPIVVERLRAAVQFGDRWRWAALAIFVSSAALPVLAHGLFGSGSGTTGAILAVSLGALFVVGNWRQLESDFSDMFFVAFLGYAVLSSLTHPWADLRESALFTMVLLSYPAGRLFRTASVDPAFGKIVLFIAMVGGAFTALALAQGSLDYLGGKPRVFGEYAAAPAQFMTPAVIAVGAIASREKLRFNWLPAIAILLLFAVFAAAMVRFTFIAAFGAGLVLALVSAPRVRRWSLIAIASLILVVAIGQVLRPTAAIKMMGFAAQSLGLSAAPPALAQPNAKTSNEVCPPIDEDNSIEVRKAVYRDWLRLLPATGGMGIGLDGFIHLSCRTAEEVHNDLLQIVLEFGWPAAGLFSSLLVIAFVRLIRDRHDEQARFGLFALTFLLLMSMAHGRVSRDAPFFFFVGYAISRVRRPS